MESQELIEAIQRILAPHKSKGLHITGIVRLLQEQEFFSSNTPEEIKTKTKELLDEHSKNGELFDRVRKPNGGIKSGYYKIRTERNRGPIPPQPIGVADCEDIDNLTHHTSFFGKAGEYAVMSELLFRGFNANNMTVDDGIDIIANKNNNFYFVQVKTTTLRENKTAIASIQQKNFDKFINQQMRYVIVVKYNKGMKYFTLSNSGIEQLKYYKALAVSERTGNISIKIRFDSNMQCPVFYDDKTIDAGFYEGFTRFEL